MSVHVAYLVVLDRDLDEELSERVVDTLNMIKGVVSVTPQEGDFVLTIATHRAKSAVRARLYDLAATL